ncbi:MAG TPA: spore coat protein U domain-containing protein [Casimicrobiaceae bacterium]|jgi:spore coat protein U-like protein|nr:spore coat protein U domain-containing protein [Casimicrobiaceae bacterium]
MNASKIAAALGMSVGLIAAGAAYAADTSNMTVQATVISSCKFNSTPTLDFGNLDPSSAANGSGSSTISFWCSKGSAYTVTAGNGNNYNAGTSTRQMKGPGATDLMAYSLTLPAAATGTGAGKSTAITFAVTGSVLNANYINATVGSYTDTVQMAVNP